MLYVIHVQEYCGNEVPKKITIRVTGGDYSRASTFWPSIEDFALTMIGMNGVLTRILRKDGGTDYRAAGHYCLRFDVVGDDDSVDVGLELLK